MKENENTIPTKDKKAIAKKILENKRKIHAFTRAGISSKQLAKEINIVFAYPV